MKTPPSITPKPGIISNLNLRRTDNSQKSAATKHNDSAAVANAASGEAAERSFAAVFDELARPVEQKQEDLHEDLLGENRSDTNYSARAERENETGRRGEDGDDERDDRHGNGFERQVNNQTTVREPARVEVAPNVRAILHIADLERIVAQVRTQTFADRREITIALNNSVLEGLRVKLSADKAGRVSAEFIAASEQVRAQLDARAGELSSLLRSRGVELAALRTSVGTGTSEDDAQNSTRQSFSAVEFAASAETGEAHAAESSPAFEANITDTSYRA